MPFDRKLNVNAVSSSRLTLLESASPHVTPLQPRAEARRRHDVGRRAGAEQRRCVPCVAPESVVGRSCPRQLFFSAGVKRFRAFSPDLSRGHLVGNRATGDGAELSGGADLTPPSREGMWTPVGRGWSHGRALAVWAAGTAQRGRLEPLPTPTRGAPAEFRAWDRLYSSAERKVTAVRL